MFYVLVILFIGFVDVILGGLGGLDLLEFLVLVNRSWLESFSCVEGVLCLDSIGGVSVFFSSLFNRLSYGVVFKFVEFLLDFLIYNEDFFVFFGLNIFKLGNFYWRVYVIECCKRESKVNVIDY